MAVGVKKSVSIGLDSVWYGKRNASGLFVGSDLALPVAGSATGSAMKQLRGVKTWPLNLQESERVTATGDNGPIATRQFLPIELPSGAPTFSVADLEFAAIAAGIKLREFAGGTFLGMQPDQLTFQDMVILNVTVGTSQDEETLGSTVYTGEIYPAVQVFYSGHSGRTERQAADFVYNLTAQKANQYPWGVLFTLADDGFLRAPAVQFHWPAPPMIEMWVGNGAQDEFDLTYRLSENSADHIAVFVEGAELTWVEGVPSAGQFAVTIGEGKDSITLGTVPDEDEMPQALYGRK